MTVTGDGAGIVTVTVDGAGIEHCGTKVGATFTEGELPRKRR